MSSHTDPCAPLAAIEPPSHPWHYLMTAVPDFNTSTKVVTEVSMTAMRNLAGLFAYVRPPEFDEAKKAMVAICQSSTSGSREFANFRYPVVQGPMGVGKTRLALELACEVAAQYDGVVLSFRMGRLRDKCDSHTTNDAVLAQAIFHALFPRSNLPASLDLGVVLSHIRRDLGKQLVILHVDEFQDSPEITRAVLSACQYTLLPGEVLVVPILSGISPANHGMTKMQLSHAQPSQIALLPLVLRPFPLGAVTKAAPLGEATPFEREFARNIEVDWAIYAACPALRFLYRDAGGHPRISKALANAIVEKVAAAQRGGLTMAQAQSVFEVVKTKLDSHYGAYRWDTVVRGQQGTEPLPKMNDWILSTERVIRRVLLCAYTDREVRPGAEVLSGIVPDSGTAMVMSRATYHGCTASGMMDFDASGKRLVAPLIALLAMDTGENRVMPCELMAVSTPFVAGDEPQERVAMASILMRASAMHEWQSGWVDVTALRPGAMHQSKRRLQVRVEGRPTFEFLSVSLGLVHDFPYERVRIAADREYAVDGLTRLRGRVVTTDEHGVESYEEVDVDWMSQSKFREIKVPETGVESLQAKLFFGQVGKLVAGMRSVARMIQAKLAAGRPRGAFVVYDVFTDRLPQATPFSEFELGDYEALLVTTNESYAQVVGKPLSERQRV